VSAIRPLVPESWGELLYDGSWHYFAFEQLSAADTTDAYVSLCRRRLFADEVILVTRSEVPPAACRQCLDELLTKSAALAGALHAEMADAGSVGGDPAT
jgi:hypothetical protein